MDKVGTDTTGAKWSRSTGWTDSGCGQWTARMAHLDRAGAHERLLQRGGAGTDGVNGTCSQTRPPPARAKVARAKARAATGARARVTGVGKDMGEGEG